MATQTITEEELALEQTPTLERIPTFVNLAHVTSADTSLTRTASISRRRTSVVEPLDTVISRGRRRSSVVTRPFSRQDIPNDQLLSLTKSASRISGHQEAYQDSKFKGYISRPKAARPGPVNTIREVPSEFTTPLSSRPASPNRLSTISRPPSPSPKSESQGLLPFDVESAASSDVDSDTESHLQPITSSQPYPDVGRIKSWRGATILVCVCGAQLLDNVFMTSINIALPAIQKEFEVVESDLHWLISAYTLTFGGFLLLSGVLADRYGRRTIFCAGMACLSIWTLANGFASSFVQMAIFRALQGVGAAATVPSSVGIISSYFVAQDRTRGLSFFGAAGAVGFCLGLILGGLLTSSLGWRWVFYLCLTLTSSIAVLGWFILPRDNRVRGTEKPRLDLLGAGLSTGGLVLLSFVLSSGGVYGWNKAFIIVMLITSVGMLCLFTFWEKKTSNPIMPLSLWKLTNFAALWVGGFVMYGGYQTVVYYTTLIAQEVMHLSAAETAVRFLPMGVTGFCCSIAMSRAVEMFNVKYLLLVGMSLCAIAPVSSAVMSHDDLNFWRHVFPTTLLAVAGTTIVYCTITVVLLASVPNNVKSLCGGMVNTAFQIGSGVGLALSSAIVQAVDVKKGHGELKQFETGLWCCVGLAGVGIIASAVGVKNIGKMGKGNGVVAVH